LRLWHRLPWLAMGLAGAMISAGLMAAFETQLQANLLIAFFVPGIVYLADAVGTQTETCPWCSGSPPFTRCPRTTSRVGWGTTSRVGPRHQDDDTVDAAGLVRLARSLSR